MLSEESRNGLLRRLRRGFAWGRLKLPFGLRTGSGVLLLMGGVLGFLPVLGFWMIPLGAALIALDVPPLRRRLRAWLHRVVPPRRQWRGRPQIGHHKDRG